MANNAEFRARQAQEDPKKMVRIWENSLKVGYEKIAKEPNVEKKKQMEGQLQYAKARLEHYKKKV